LSLWSTSGNEQFMRPVIVNRFPNPASDCRQPDDVRISGATFLISLILKWSHFSLPNVEELLVSSFSVSGVRIMEQEDVRLYYQRCAEDIALENATPDDETMT